MDMLTFTLGPKRKLGFGDEKYEGRPKLFLASGSVRKSMKVARTSHDIKPS